MYISRVGYGINTTINTGSYQAIKPDGYAQVTLNEGDDPGKALELARKWALISFVKASDDGVKILDWAGKYQDGFTKNIIQEMINEITEDMA
jgi:hypothetical protein